MKKIIVLDLFEDLQDDHYCFVFQIDRNQVQVDRNDGYYNGSFFAFEQ